MAVSTLDTLVTRLGTGNELEFDFDFQVLDADHVVVSVNGVMQDAGLVVVAYEDQASTPGGTVLFDTAPVDRAIVEITRITPLDQSFAVPAAGAFPVGAVERTFDKAFMALQEFHRRTSTLNRNWADGIWVGTNPPSNPITYPEWLAGGQGYWGWLNPSDLLSIISVTAVGQPAEVRFLAWPGEARSDFSESTGVPGIIYIEGHDPVALREVVTSGQPGEITLAGWLGFAAVNAVDARGVAATFSIAGTTGAAAQARAAAGVPAPIYFGAFGGSTSVGVKTAGAAAAFTITSLASAYVDNIACAQPMNAEFETAISATTEQTGAWWKVLNGASAVAGVTAEGQPSSVGQVRASSGDAAMLRYKFLKSELDVRSGLQFFYQALDVSSGGRTLDLIAYDGSNNVLGTRGLALPASALSAWVLRTYDMRYEIETGLGVSWANVAYVYVSFRAQPGINPEAGFYIDKFFGAPFTTNVSATGVAATITLNGTAAGAKVAVTITGASQSFTVSGSVGSVTIEAGASPAAVSDNFNRSNGSVGANWTTPASSFGSGGNVSVPQISSNAVAAMSHALAYWGANSFNNNQYAECKVTNGGIFGSTGTLFEPGGPMVRASSGNFYVGGPSGWDDGESGASEVAIWKCVAGTHTKIATGATGYADTIFRIEADGTTIRLLSGTAHGSLTQRLSVTDSSLTSGAAGFGQFVAGADVNTAIDDWYGGDLVAVSDNFNRSNGGLGANWAAMSGIGTGTMLQIQSNACRAYYNAARWNANSFNSNQYAEGKSGNGSDAWCYQEGAAWGLPGSPGVAVRMQSSKACYLATSLSYYDPNLDEGNARVELWRLDEGGGLTLIGSSASGTLDPIIRIEANGSTIRVLTGSVHGSLTQRISVTDTALTGGSPGISSPQGLVVMIDDWYGGDL